MFVRKIYDSLAYDPMTIPTFEGSRRFCSDINVSPCPGLFSGFPKRTYINIYKHIYIYMLETWIGVAQVCPAVARATRIWSHSRCRVDFAYFKIRRLACIVGVVSFKYRSRNRTSLTSKLRVVD